MASPSTAVRRGLPLLVYELLVMFLLVLPSVVHSVLLEYLIIVMLGIMSYALIKKYGMYMINVHSIYDLQQLSIVVSSIIGILVLTGIQSLQSITISSQVISLMQLAIGVDIFAMILNVLEFSNIMQTK